VTLPTQLSLLRIALTFVVIGLLLRAVPATTIAAAVLFAIASFTDWLDGYLARHWNLKSDLGALLDPIADKILVLGTFLAFVPFGLVPAWMFAAIALREVAVTAVRLAAARRGVVLAAEKEGKYKTVFQMLTLLILFWNLIDAQLAPPYSDARAHPILPHAAAVSLWVTVALTLYSGATFFWQHRLALRNAFR
jgi:CDP-diacylglycerol--glycerol-3-phosphate 3-phosphatidyltransferase